MSFAAIEKSIPDAGRQLIDLISGMAVQKCRFERAFCGKEAAGHRSIPGPSPQRATCAVEILISTGRVEQDPSFRATALGSLEKCLPRKSQCHGFPTDGPVC